MSQTSDHRRPIKARSAAWAQGFARWLAQRSITPNQISVASIGFAALGAWLLWRVPSLTGWLGCAACIQARLLCNLFDGLVAVEGGKRSAVGELYNEFPDRVADSLLLVALGYASGWPWLGWFCALAAALTAYVRVSGGALGFAQDFRGPMAKQHRMAVLTVACVVAGLEDWFNSSRYALLTAAVVIAVGAVLTCFTRTRAIAQQLRTK